MATKNIRSPLDSTEYASLAEPLRNIILPRNILGNLGIFQNEFLNSKTLVLPRTTSLDFAMQDNPWGTRMFNTQDDKKQLLSVPVPHFGVEDAITVEDVVQKVKWEDFFDTRSLEIETVGSVQLRKLNQARRNVNRLWDNVQMNLLRDGTVYAPNGTVVVNWYTEFGVTRSDVNLVVSDPLVDPKTSIQAVIDTIQANFQGGYDPSRFMGLLGRTLFDNLAAHPAVRDAARYGALTGSQNAEVLAGRLGVSTLDASAYYQVLDFGGVVFVRLNDTEMPANEGRVFPTDVDGLFRTYFAPAQNTFDQVNDVAEDVYYEIKMNYDRDRVRIRYESNPIAVSMHPSSIVRVVGA